MESKDTGLYLMYTFVIVLGMGITMTNAIVCRDTWQIIWIAVASISVVCFIVGLVAGLLSEDKENRESFYGMFGVYSAVMFVAGCGTAVFTWGQDLWVLILTFPFGLIGLALAPFAVAGIVFITIVVVGNCYTEHQEAKKSSPKRRNKHGQSLAVQCDITTN